MGFTLRRVYDSATTTLQQQHLREVVLLARSINSDMRSLSRIAETTAAFLDINPSLSEDDLYGLLRQNTSRNQLLYGSAIAFEPGAYRGKSLFSPYVYGRDLKQMDIGKDAYDYTDGRWEWYSGVKETHAGLWTEPYFDEGAGQLEMTTYSHPVLRDGQFIGVTTIDLRLDQLSSTISSQLDGEMFMIMSPTGTFVSHYLPDQALHGSLQDFG
ncbi:MAG: cache domain-containing protein, partial [Pseudomonadota bacterium]|nr:cache domain-containing protein [Pseudomonadota bacterium]